MAPARGSCAGPSLVDRLIAAVAVRPQSHGRLALHRGLVGGALSGAIRARQAIRPQLPPLELPMLYCSRAAVSCREFSAPKMRNSASFIASPELMKAQVFQAAGRQGEQFSAKALSLCTCCCWGAQTVRPAGPRRDSCAPPPAPIQVVASGQANTTERRRDRRQCTSRSIGSRWRRARRQ